MNPDLLAKHMTGFFTEMIKSKMVPVGAFVGGVSRFLQILCGLVADVPALPKLFTNGVLMPCINAQAFKFSQIKWQAPPQEGEEDYLEVEGHYIVMANVIVDQCKGMSIEDKKKWFKTNVPLMTEDTYLEAVPEANYLIDLVTESLGCSAEEGEEVCGIMGFKRE
jgi:hypothetical protein